MAWPNETVAVLMKPPQSGQSGAQPLPAVHSSAHPAELVAAAAVETMREGGIAVQFDDVCGAIPEAWCRLSMFWVTTPGTLPAR